MRVLCFITIVIFILAYVNAKSFDSNEVIPRDAYPTRCYKFLNPTSQFHEGARRQLCVPGEEKCACSCQESCRQRQERYQKCCKASGVKLRCMHLCRYDVDPLEFLCKYKECADNYKQFVYCAADSDDMRPNLQCCQQREVPAVCDGFCSGTVPDRHSFNTSMLSCLHAGSRIMKCHADHLPQEVSWNKKNVKFPPQPPFEDWQLDLIDSVTKSRCN